MVNRDRGISTVMDVSLALLIISATVLLIGLYLQSDDDPIDGDRGDQALQTLSGSTVTITYDVSEENESGYAATDSDHYDTPDDLEPDDVNELYEITTYGSATDLLGEAAMTNLQIEGTELFAYGHDVERSVDGAIRGRLVGSEGTVYAVATWEPYDGASINGTATAGERPPRTEDVSSSTTEVSATVRSVDSERLATLFEQGEEASPHRSEIDDGFDLVGEEIASAMVEGYFPPEQTQYTLESSLMEHAVTLYNYRRIADAAAVDIEDDITGTKPDAIDANDHLVNGDRGAETGLARIIADDLRTSPAGEEIRTTYDEFGDELTPAEETALEETFEEEVSTGTIEITVQTWE
ncbi:DUF7284 family protein [Natrinema longum]|uniref:Uncharacterized protein n=1 Tax=Natrinema longum TaxID=370324 RepID=A0A8A2UA35_9EURY|nr:hypothetical protein [Natrinema longum]MBZ6493601.1 hypothetical protein [Natrinema longum]QSW85055.1 hypothetical protein J0X27_16660 [Natrinema longum]